MGVISKALSRALEVLTEPKGVFAGRTRPELETLDPASVFEVQECFPGFLIKFFLFLKS